MNFCICLTLDKLYRKDRTNHGGGISSSLLHQRVIKLIETVCEESILISIALTQSKLLIGTFYSLQTSDLVFAENFNVIIGKANEITNNIVILCNLNEDLLNTNLKKLKDILIIHSLQRVMSEPIRLNALLDLILVIYQFICNF